MRFSIALLIALPAAAYAAVFAERDCDPILGRKGMLCLHDFDCCSNVCITKYNYRVCLSAYALSLADQDISFAHKCATLLFCQWSK